jgi:hypothetical protein
MGRSRGNSGINDRAMDLRPDLPLSTDKIRGLDLTHIIYTSDVAAARSGGAGHDGPSAARAPTTAFAPYTSGPADAASGFNITIEFKGSWTADYYNVFKSAADRLTSLIVGELSDVAVRARGGTKIVDDILINAELGRIDGLYGILGQAGPTSVRTNGSLPATAQMKFDIADVNAMGIADFTYVVLHEMAHSLGFGSIWGRLGLVSNGTFTGLLANAEYQKLGGNGRIPVEQDGGSGTAGSHWDDQTFRNELLTGYIDDGYNPFSAMSAASFADLGYQITPNYAAWADAYALV